MPNILIRDVDPDVHATLSARAARQGQSLQQYLTAELRRLAEQPTLAELFAEIESRGGTGFSVDPEDIVAALHSERAGR